MVNQSQSQAFSAEFYSILEEEKRKEAIQRERNRVLAEKQQKLLDEIDGIEKEDETSTEVKIRKAIKGVKGDEMTKKKNRKVVKADLAPEPEETTQETQEEITTEKVTEQTKPAEKKIAGWWKVKARNDIFCTKCAKPIIKGQKYFWKSKGKTVHIACK